MHFHLRLLLIFCSQRNVLTKSHLVYKSHREQTAFGIYWFYSRGRFLLLELSSVGEFNSWGHILGAFAHIVRVLERGIQFRFWCMRILVEITGIRRVDHIWNDCKILRLKRDSKMGICAWYLSLPSNCLIFCLREKKRKVD